MRVYLYLYIGTKNIIETMWGNNTKVFKLYEQQSPQLPLANGGLGVEPSATRDFCYQFEKRRIFKNILI